MQKLLASLSPAPQATVPAPTDAPEPPRAKARPRTREEEEADAVASEAAATPVATEGGGPSGYLYAGGAALLLLGVAGGGGGGGSSGPEAQGSNDPRPKPDAQPGPTPQPDPAPGPKPEPQPKPEPEPKPEPQPKPEPEPKPEPQPKPEPEPKPEPPPKPDPEPKPEPQPKPDPETKPEPEPKPDPDPKPEPEPKPDPEPNPKPDPEPNPKPDPEPNPKPEPEPLPPPPRPTLRLLRDTGAPITADPNRDSTRDGVTADATVLVEGLVPGARWHYSMDGTTWFEGTDGRVESGFFDDGDGAKVVHVQQAIEGAASPSPIQTLSFVLDTEPPAPAGIRLVNDTGADTTDRVTADPRLVLDLAPGATWTYTFDTGHTGTVVGGNTIPAFELPDGTRTVEIIQYDGAGNSTARRLTFELDRTRPSMLSATLLNDTGASATDGVTRDGTIQVSGLTPGCRWQYRIDNGSWRDGDDSMRIETAALGKDGYMHVDIAQVDRAGNRSEEVIVRLELDREAHAPTLRLKHDTGSSDSDYVTADPALALSGLERGATWELLGSGGLHASGTSADTLPTPSMSSDILRMRVRQTDLAGNVSDYALPLQAFVTSEDEANARQPVLRPAAGPVLSGTSGQDDFVWTANANGTASYLTNYRRDQNDVLDLSAVLTVGPGKTIRDVVTKDLRAGGILGIELLWRADDGRDTMVAMWNVAATDTILIRTSDGLHVL